MKTRSRDRAVSAAVPAQACACVAAYQTGERGAWGQRVVYRRLIDPARLRALGGRRASRHLLRRRRQSPDVAHRRAFRRPARRLLAGGRGERGPAAEDARSRVRRTHRALLPRAVGADRTHRDLRFPLRGSERSPPGGHEPVSRWLECAADPNAGAERGGTVVSPLCEFMLFSLPERKLHSGEQRGGWPWPPQDMLVIQGARDDLRLLPRVPAALQPCGDRLLRGVPEVRRTPSDDFEARGRRRLQADANDLASPQRRCRGSALAASSWPDGGGPVTIGDRERLLGRIRQNPSLSAAAREQPPELPAEPAEGFQARARAAGRPPRAPIGGATGLGAPRVCSPRRADRGAPE